jgi:ketosteroid isomerase-like protein
MSRSLCLAAALFLMTPAVAVQAHDPAPAPASQAQGALQAEAVEPAAVVDAFHAALKAGDTAGALALLAEEAMIFEAGGAERSRAEYASHHLGADAAFAAAVESTMLRRSGRVDGDMAWIMSEGRTTGQFNGRAVDRLTAETMVLRRGPDGWRIQHIHWSSRGAG